MTDRKYKIARNKLIPSAEKYANKKEGKTNKPPQSHEDWVKRWNLAFLGRMDELWQGKKGW